MNALFTEMLFQFKAESKSRLIWSQTSRQQYPFQAKSIGPIHEKDHFSQKISYLNKRSALQVSLPNYSKSLWLNKKTNPSACAEYHSFCHQTAVAATPTHDTYCTTTPPSWPDHSKVVCYGPAHASQTAFNLSFCA